MRLETKRVLARGRHRGHPLHLILRPGESGLALADFFRIEGGKVVEHWEVIKPVPATAQDDNAVSPIDWSRHVASG